MTKGAFSWLEIGRRVGRDERFRTPNVQMKRRFLKEQAAALEEQGLTSKKLAEHTLQRIANVANFVDEKLDQNVDWSNSPLATLEVIMRIAKIDASTAYGLLEQLRSGELRFRAALGAEESLRKNPDYVRRTHNRKVNRSKDMLRAIVMSAWRTSLASDPVWIDPKTDWRFPLVKPHGVVLAPLERSACFFDAKLLVSGLNHRRIVDEFIREVLAACALFTIVLVIMTEGEDADRFLDLFEKSENKPGNLTLVVGEQVVLQKE